MKSLILILLVGVTYVNTYAQFNIKRELPSLLTSFGAGMQEGGAETLKFHFYKVRKKYPGVNEKYWNPDISWVNKYKNGDVNQGPKYFGSTSFLVWTTDGYHLLRMQRNFLLQSTFVLRISLSEKRKWYWYLVDATVHGLAYQTGFYLIYNVTFK